MMKRTVAYIVIALVAVILIGGILGKNALNKYISHQMQQPADPEQVDNYILSNYNYSQNGREFDFTLLEFGSTGCIMCKQMEPVLETIRQSSKPKVNVVFLHIMKPENQGLMKHYGVSAVPMQVILDREGVELFRNYGVITAPDLLARMQNIKK